MLYQETFQNGENTSEINVSCCVYINGQNGKNCGFPIHCHSFFEMEYIIDGSGVLQMNGKHIKVSQNSLIIKPPLCAHGAIGNGKSTNMVIQFGTRFLSQNAISLPKNSLLLPNKKVQETGFITIEKGSYMENCLLELVALVPSFITPFDLMEHRIKYTPEYEWKLNALTLNLITCLVAQRYLTIIDNVGNFSDVTQIQAVLSRLITKPEEKLTVEDAAKMACMSYSYFSRVFTKIIGRSFIDYCNGAKVHRAEELLESSELSITEISRNLGFGTVSYFNRIFKNYTGSTPMQYRNRIKSK